MSPSSLFRFLRDRSGQAILVFTLASPIAIGGAGMAVDVSMWVRQKDSLQLLADSAALAAASQLAKGGTTTERIDRAETVALGFVETNSGGRAMDVDIDVASMRAEVSVREPAIISFGKMFGIDQFDLSADSTASLATTEARACVIALDPAAKIGVNIGGTGDFLADDCWVKSHATSDGSITIGGSAKVSAAVLCAAGKVRINGTSASISPKTVQADECLEKTNPFAGQWPATTLDTSKCQKNVSINSKTDVTLAAGTYCGGLSVSSDGNIKMSGKIVVQGGLKLTAKGNIEGSDVQIHLVGAGSTFDIAGQGRVVLAATPGTKTPGLVLVSDEGQTGTNLVSKITGGAYVDLTGSVYLPEQDFVWRGNSKSAAASKLTVLVAKTVDIAGTTNIQYQPWAEETGLVPVTIRPLISYLEH